MSNVSIVTLFAAIVMIILAVFLEFSVVAGGAGVLFVVGLGYAYVVATREVAAMRHAIDTRFDDTNPPVQEQEHSPLIRAKEEPIARSI